MEIRFPEVVMSGLRLSVIDDNNPALTIESVPQPRRRGR